MGTGVMLAQNWDPDRHVIDGWYASEKFDGMRALWDGGTTRGMRTSEVPFANTAKDGRYIRPPVSTGLWTRLWKPIRAPDWWLDTLPNFPLDGELYMGRRKFQALMSTCKTLEPGVGWQAVKYMVFDSPKYGNFLEPEQVAWLRDCVAELQDPGAGDFESVQERLRDRADAGAVWRTVDQERVPSVPRMLELLDGVVAGGGEGLMLRRPGSRWRAERSRDLLKVKKYLDAEATVQGFTWGLGKYRGMMGALKCEFNGVEFELSGFTDAERVVVGQTVPAFPVLGKVTFRYRELTDGGVPKEARYWRRR